MSHTFRDAAIACAFAFTYGPTYAAPQQPITPALQLDSAGVVAWKEDLRYMADEMARRHKNLYPTVSRADFDSVVPRWIVELLENARTMVKKLRR